MAGASTTWPQWDTSVGGVYIRFVQAQIILQQDVMAQRCTMQGARAAGTVALHLRVLSKSPRALEECIQRVISEFLMHFGGVIDTGGRHVVDGTDLGCAVAFDSCNVAIKRAQKPSGERSLPCSTPNLGEKCTSSIWSSWSGSGYVMRPSFASLTHASFRASA